MGVVTLPRGTAIDAVFASRHRVGGSFYVAKDIAYEVKRAWNLAVSATTDEGYRAQLIQNIVDCCNYYDEYSDPMELCRVCDWRWFVDTVERYIG